MLKWILVGTSSLLLIGCQPSHYGNSVTYQRPVQGVTVVTEPTRSSSKASYKSHSLDHSIPTSHRVIVRY